MIKPRYGHYIGGKFVEPIEGGHFTSFNPATEQPVTEVAEGSAADVARAVEAAREALPAWSALPAIERGK